MFITSSLPDTPKSKSHGRRDLVCLVYDYALAQCLGYNSHSAFTKITLERYTCYPGGKMDYDRVRLEEVDQLGDFGNVTGKS